MQAGAEADDSAKDHPSEESSGGSDLDSRPARFQSQPQQKTRLFLRRLCPTYTQVLLSESWPES